jgi:type IV pilus biogenesis protein CpaD/CtpE
MRPSLYIPLALALLAGCAASPKMGNVIPAENDQYQVIAIGKTADIALASALYSAQSTCKHRGLRHIVLAHKTEYKGMLAEGSAESIDKALAIILQQTGEQLPKLATDDDYRTNMQFKCE